MKSVRGLSVMWGVDYVGREWSFFVKAPGFPRMSFIGRAGLDNMFSCLY